MTPASWRRGWGEGAPTVKKRLEEVVALKDATAQAQGVRASYLVGTDWLTLPRVALEMAVSINSVREWAHRENDPLPVRYPPGNSKQGRVYRPDLNEWALRNFRKEGA